MTRLMASKQISYERISGTALPVFAKASGADRHVLPLRGLHHLLDDPVHVVAHPGVAT